MISNRLRPLLLTLILCQLFIPLVLSFAGSVAFRIRPLRPFSVLLEGLNGPSLVGVTAGSSPEGRKHLNFRSLMNGTFQSGYSDWFAQNFPLRRLLVRISNEIDFVLFHDHNGAVVVGKDNELYEESYLTEYCNITPAIDNYRLTSIVRQMAMLRERLAKRNATLTILITPSKASTYPEDIPQVYLAHKNNAPRSYDEVIPLLKQYGVPYVDGPAIMRSAKADPTLGSLLFCQGGTHWSLWAAFLATKSLVTCLRGPGSVSLPTLTYASVPIDDKPTDQDRDLADLMNLVRPRTDYPVPHPVIQRSGAAGPAGGKLVVIGGSFCNRPLAILNDQKLFRSIRFYFYYRRSLTVFPENRSSPVDVAAIDWPSQIGNADHIVLEINEQAFGSGTDTHYSAFLDDALKHIHADGTCD